MGVFVEGAAGGGVDNSKFATAKAANIEKGFTAEVMGALVTGTMIRGVDLSDFGISKMEKAVLTKSSDTYTNWETVNHSLNATPKLLYVRAKTKPSGTCNQGHHLTHAIISNISPVPFAIYLGVTGGTRYSVGYNSTQAYSLTASSVKLGNCGIDVAMSTDGTNNNTSYNFAAGVQYEFFIYA